MQFAMIRKINMLVSKLVIATCLLAAPAFAQFQNPIQAAKDAWKKAKQEQQQGQPPPQAAPPAAQPANPPANTSSQPAASQPAGTAPTPQPVSSSTSAGAPAQGAAPTWTPPSDTAMTGKVAAPAGPLDPSKLPDVAGIHVGTPSDEIPGLIKKLHSNATMDPQIGYIRGTGIAVADKQQAGVWMKAQVTPGQFDSIYVDYTWSPNKPLTVLIRRAINYPQPLIHQNLVDALRQKYGKELWVHASVPNHPTDEPENDGQIDAMWWVFDEQGHLLPPGPHHNGAYGCDYEQEGGKSYSQMIMNYLNNSLPAATFCDSVIVLYVQFTPSGVVGSTDMTLVDRALMRRSVIATGDWARAGAQKQHQQEQQKANQAKPTL